MNEGGNAVRKQSKLAWIFEVVGLFVVLLVVVNARMDEINDVLFTGSHKTLVSTDSVTFNDPNATPPPDENALVWPILTLDEMQSNRQYAIVNDDNLLSAAYPSKEVEFGTIEGTRMLFLAEQLPYLEAMLQDLRDAGFSVYVAGAFRTYSYQEKLFNSKASQIAVGMKPPVTDYLDPRYQEAVAEARTITAFPGSSEHQLGLAVDLMDRDYGGRMDYSRMNKEFFAYLDSICAKYGFIKRYPSNKLLITGWDEPYHYRYVGEKAATFIMENGLCYEEFYAHYDPDFEL